MSASDTTLVQHLERELDEVPVPPADLDAVRRRGRVLRRRRRAAGVGVVAAVGVLAGSAVVLTPWSGAPEGADPERPAYAGVGELDLSEGLRAFADPGGVVSLGGRTVPGEQLDYLDTDAAATPYGIVFFDDSGQPRLLGADGSVALLHEGRSDGDAGFHPTAKVDATQPHVAYATLSDGTVTLVVQDLETRELVATRELPCTGGCEDVVIDGIDSGAVFVRTGEGTWMWGYDRGAVFVRTGEDTWMWGDDGEDLVRFAGPRTRVADVRNRVVLYDGPEPTLPLSAWRYRAGAIDAQLTFDGRHVLYWSPVLEPVGAGSPLELPLPEPATFFTFDTDGSVLAATSGSPARFFDCALPAGPCEPIGELEVTGGDPMFIGDDM